jgi:hypothetical protein
MLTALLSVLVSGAVGGVVNALISNNGFPLPKRVQVDGIDVLRPGVLGNVLMGGVAAVISWGLYGPASGTIIVGGRPATDTMALTLSAIAGALLVGAGGARWLTNEVDKRLLKAAASQAALSAARPDLAARLTVAPPAHAFEIARAAAYDRS